MACGWDIYGKLLILCSACNLSGDQRLSPNEAIARRVIDRAGSSLLESDPEGDSRGIKALVSILEKRK